MVTEKIIKTTPIINCHVVNDITAVTIYPLVKSNVDTCSTIITDEYNSYNELDKIYQHATVNHCAKEYVNQMVYTNGVENFWSHLKRGIDGIYRWVSTGHLQAYVNEYSLRFNTRTFTTVGRLDLV